jgi:hypothetical protein
MYTPGTEDTLNFSALSRIVSWRWQSTNAPGKVSGVIGSSSYEFEEFMG